MIIFKEIPGYPRYEVSNTGKVRRKEDGSLLEGGLSSQGYPKVKLTNEDGERKDENVHALESRAFYGEIPGARIVHLNGVKTDNRLANLHPQIADPILAQRAFQRKIKVLRARRERTIRHGDGRKGSGVLSQCHLARFKVLEKAVFQICPRPGAVGEAGQAVAGT